MSDALLNINRGRTTRQVLPVPHFPNADDAVHAQMETRPADAVDILFVNPPAPDRGIWIRSQHRVGRRSREGQIWPQVDLAQMAALFPDRRVDIVDAIPQRMTWKAFEALLWQKRPRYYVTQVTAPTLQNDMFGVFLAKALGATTLAFGTHVTPIPRETMRAYPALDYILYGEPELTLREIVATLERSNVPTLNQILGLVWRDGNDVIINPPRPFIEDLDALPLPRHDLLPFQSYRAPLVGGPYTFVVSSRGCPAQCRFCIKHVSYGHSVRFRSPENVLAEIEQLVNLGIRKIHMYADLFTINRDHAMGISQGLLDRGLKIRWTCNSRVDFVDPELLQTMARSGCWMISWGIESADPAMLERMHKGITPADVERALRWSKEAGIMNWGYFIIGLPGETEDSIRKTITFAKKLPLDIALFHIAAPHPGTPFFFEVVENGWFRPGTRWEEVDMDRSTVLDYPNLKAEDLERWAKRAFREWALRPGPLWTYLKMLGSSPSLWRAALDIGLESLGWVRGD
ncbi:MAG TPA: radical SAM protein [Anaerolineae bacterium]|nr:radical SAM protein [Anaerolineae bacterium]HQH38282.1 radical SAM protein [Anaerolineae bacterium]